MASKNSKSPENHPKSPSNASYPKDSIPTPLSPFNAIPNKITSPAHLAIPFISILIGVSSLHPTKPIYAIYSPDNASLQYVHGDGTIVDALSICPLLSFNNGDPICSRQRFNMIECMNRSATYYQIVHCPSWNEDGIYEKAFRGPFTNQDAVKKALTYVSDLRFGPDNIAALRTLPLDRHLISNVPDANAPCISLTAPPRWNFSVHRADFGDPQLDPTQESRLLGFFQKFIQRYRNHVSYPIFKKAAYVLSGLEQVGAINWQSGHEGEKTHGGWTVDDFLARFAKYEQFTEEWRFLYAPNPIAWLEAEMEDEMRRERMGGRRRRKVPWMGLLDGVEMVGVVDWEELAEFYWGDGEGGNGYPRLFVREKDEDGFVDDTEIPIKNEELEETEMRDDNSHQQGHADELGRKGHGKNNKRSREEHGESSAIKRAKPAALNIISSSR